MGGKKKLTLKQMEKAQARADSKTEGKSKQRETAAQKEKKSTRIIPPSLNDEKLIKELQKIKVLTPYTVASRLDLRLSVAKDFLEELQRRGVVTEVSSGRNIKIYTPSK
ncbi:MAG: hypothetical protein QXX08_02760 [Candidatus Bathyarchaeia archaeon]